MYTLTIYCVRARAHTQTHRGRSVPLKSSHCYHNKNSLCNTDVTWQPRRVDWNAQHKQ